MFIMNVKIALFISWDIIKERNGVNLPSLFTCICMQLRWGGCDKVETRPGVQQCQAQELVFCPWLGLFQDMNRMCKNNLLEDTFKKYCLSFKP